MSVSNRMAVLAVFGAVAVAGCEDGAVTPDGESDFAILMQAESGVAASLLAPGSLDGARIDLALVESIVLPIGEVEASRADGGEDGGWVSAGFVDADVDLLALPSDGVTLLESSLEEGRYTNLRFRLDGTPTITLSEEVTVGRTLYEAGTHDLVIPSADQAGVRMHADFEVDEDGEVLTVLFDGDATVRNVTATGAGDLKIAPRLKVRNDAGDDVGGNDDGDDEEDGDGEIEVDGRVISVNEDGFTFEDGSSVVIEDGTEIGGDLLSLVAVAEALLADEVVEAEVEGRRADDDETIIASSVRFEVRDDD